MQTLFLHIKIGVLKFILIWKIKKLIHFLGISSNLNNLSLNSNDRPTLPPSPTIQQHPTRPSPANHSRHALWEQLYAITYSNRTTSRMILVQTECAPLDRDRPAQTMSRPLKLPALPPSPVHIFELVASFAYDTSTYY